MIKEKRRVHFSLRGFALPTTLILTTIAAVGGALTLKLVFDTAQATRQVDDNETRSLFLAQAAVERGIAGLREAYEDSQSDWRNLPEQTNSFIGPVQVQLGPDLNLVGTYELASVVEIEPGVLEFTGEGIYKGEIRSIIQIVEFQMSKKFGSAIISDSPTFVDTGSGGKKQAQNGDVVITNKGCSENHVSVIGGISANGRVLYDSTEVTSETANNYFNNLADQSITEPIASNLWGTEYEIPDYTEPGAPDQLFNFDDFITAADNGSGMHFLTLEAFIDAARAGVPLNGIVVIDVNPANFVEAAGGGKKKGGGGVAKLTQPKLYEDAGVDGGGKYYNIPSIDVTGTLLFNISPTYMVEGTTYETPPLFKIFLETPININASPQADLDFYLNTTLPNYMSLPPESRGNPPFPPSGYPPDYPSMGLIPPWESNPSYFNEDADLPAMMYNTGILDIHRDANVSGVLYTPSFVEIEQKQDGRNQIFNGSIIAGGGIYLEAQCGSGVTLVNFDQDVMDNLATSNNKGKAPFRTAWFETVGQYEAPVGL